MKRHAALQDLSRDHLFALRLAHRIYQAERGFHGAPTLQEAGRALVASYEEDLIWHFREEEEVLLPVLARHFPITSREEVRCMLDDHAWLRDALARMGRAGEKDVLDEDLVVAAGKRLHDHVRLEERRLFVLMQELLDDDELEEIRSGSEAFRRRFRSEEVIGPFRTHG